MNRFQKNSIGAELLGRIASVVFFLGVLAAFIAGLNRLSGITAREEAEGLRSSILRGAVHCYALEGFYPDSLAYLEDHYGLEYDKDKYLISYEIIGSNLMPDVTVITRG